VQNHGFSVIKLKSIHIAQQIQLEVFVVVWICVGIFKITPTVRYPSQTSNQLYISSCSICLFLWFNV